MGKLQDFLLLLLVIALLISLPIISILIANTALKAILFAAVIAVLAGAFRFNQWRERVRVNKAFETKEANVKRRIAELSAMVSDPNFELIIRGSQFRSLFSLYLVALGGCFIIAGLIKGYVVFLLVGIVIFAIAPIILLAQILAIGKPLLIVTRQGILVRNIGTIFWKEIDRISVQDYTGRAFTVHILIFSVPNLNKVYKNAHGLFSFFYQIRLKTPTQLSIILNSDGEDSEVVLYVCKLLWAKNTGRDHEWISLMSEAANVAAQIGNVSLLGQPGRVGTLLCPRGYHITTRHDLFGITGKFTRGTIR